MGKGGLTLISIITLISVYVLLTYPIDFGSKYWSNPAHWADNPKVAPPAWINLIASSKMPEHRVYKLSHPTNVVKGKLFKISRYSFNVEYYFDDYPEFLVIKVRDVVFHRKPPMISVYLIRPDGVRLSLIKESVPGVRMGEAQPFKRFFEEPMRIELTNDRRVAFNVIKYVSSRTGVTSVDELMDLGLTKVFFSESMDGLRVLKGRYVILIEVSMGVDDSVGLVEVILGGSVYGLMGTDSLGRDLAKGLLFGFPVALFIGVVTSTSTTALGSLLGIISGYLGGAIDTLIQRTCDVLANIPLLPILIFMTFVSGQKLWVIILIMVLFGWSGLTILVRSMVLQLKSSLFIEAALAIGASKWRIMVKHIFPQIAPFIFAQMVFFTPSAILAEAALSFMGLGDPSIPTWGQILEYGFRNGGIYHGYWWWVVPPGALIIITAVGFMFLALALEPIVNPRIRKTY